MDIIKRRMAKISLFNMYNCQLYSQVTASDSESEEFLKEVMINQNKQDLNFVSEILNVIF
jgi:hypothetical protein